MIYFITGNLVKLAELKAILPSELSITHRALDLDEMQSFDLHEIVRHKLQHAYGIVKAPVMVEDVSAGLASMNGFPGPFIKYLFERMGDHALYEIGTPNDRIHIVCTMGYFDGTHEIIVDGVQDGTVVAPRGESGFGFDSTIVPDGYDQTLAELGQEIKNKISHRHNAIVAMVDALKQAGIC